MKVVDQKIFAGGGMQLDIEPNLIPENQTGRVLNLRSFGGDEQTTAAKATIKGNTQVSLPEGKTLPPTAWVVGQTRYGSKIYYFVCCEGQREGDMDHCILEYDNGSISVVLEDDLLNFDTEYYVDSDAIDGLLYFTDNLNPPRKINIQKAKDYSQGLATGYSVITEDIMSVAKAPPQLGPIAFYQSDQHTDFNNLRGNLWQFAYQYVYDDDEESVLSPYSNVPLPQGEEKSTGVFVDDIHQNNEIAIKINTGEENVRLIRIYYRKGNLGNWFLFREIDKSVDSIPNNYDLTLGSQYTITGNPTFVYNYSYRGFYNDLTDIPLTSGTDLQHYVPKLAGAQTIAENSLVYGNYLEGYDNIEVDVDLTVSHKEFITSASTRLILDTYSEFIQDPSGDYTLFVVVLPGTPYVGSEYIISIGAVEYSVVMQSTDLAQYPYSIASSLGGLISADGVAQDVSITYNRVNIELSGLLRDDYVSGEVRPTASLNSKVPSFKKGATHYFGIVYRDEYGRMGAVQTSDQMKVYVPFYAQGSPFYNTAYRVRIDYELNHTPPIWAHSYSFVYGGSTTVDEFIQIHIPTGGTRVSSNRTFLKINKAIVDYATSSKNSIIAAYEFKKGDRLRVVANGSGTTYTVPGSYTDVEILGVYDNTLDLDQQELELPLITLSGFGDGSLVEIYRPASNADPSERIFYEIAHYKIVDSDHEFVQGSLENGDVYMFRRTIDGTTAYNVESYHFSDYYSSRSHNYGRPNAVILDAKEKRYPTGLKHSQRKITGSKVNGLSNFDSESVLHPERYGDIVALNVVGDVLKVNHHNKLVGRYIGKVKVYNANGQSELSVSDNLLGSLYDNVYEYGCLNPESVTVYNGHLYFVDIKAGHIVRDSSNGSFPISSYGIKQYVQNKSKALIESGNTWIPTGFYPGQDEFVVSFIDKNDSTNNETIVFAERGNKWDYFASFVGQLYSNTQADLVSFYQGKFYLHGYNDYNYFYGKQYDSEIEVIFNKEFPVVKILQDIAIWGEGIDGVFVDSVELPPVAGGNGMMSRIPANYFKAKEGVMRAPFLRDMTTTQSVKLLMTGKKLRCNYGRINIKIPVTGQKVIVPTIQIKAIISE